MNTMHEVMVDTTAAGLKNVLMALVLTDPMG